MVQLVPPCASLIITPFFGVAIVAIPPFSEVYMVWDCQFACGDGLVIGEEKKNVAPQYVPIFGSAVDANWV